MNAAVRAFMALVLVLVIAVAMALLIHYLSAPLPYRDPEPPITS